MVLRGAVGDGREDELAYATDGTFLHVGGDPPHPPCICPPTRPFRCAPAHCRAEGLTALVGESTYLFSESFGVLCTKDAPPSRVACALHVGGKAPHTPRVPPPCVWRALCMWGETPHAHIVH